MSRSENREIQPPPLEIRRILSQFVQESTLSWKEFEQMLPNGPTGASDYYKPENVEELHKNRELTEQWLEK